MLPSHPAVSAPSGELPEDLHAALMRLAGAPRLLIALDFDGTLAPEVDHPADARALPKAQEAVLRLLALPDTNVALISGRRLSSLEHVAKLPDSVLLAGSHGVELRLGKSDAVITLQPDEMKRLAELGGVLDSVAKRFDGVWLEPKPAGIAMHTRLATEADARAAYDLALSEVAARVDGLTVRHGKNVLEFSVRSTTKAYAIEELRNHTGASAVMFAGDDVTDEDAFSALRPTDVGVKVGPGQTSARFRVADPAAFASTLMTLADLGEARGFDRRDDRD